MFGVGAVILTGMTCGLGVGVLVATGWVACLLWVPGRMIVHSLGTAVCKLLGNGSFVSGHYNWLGVFCLAMPSHKRCSLRGVLCCWPFGFVLLKLSLGLVL